MNKDSTAIFYILFSKTLNRFYIGITTTSIQERLHKHNTASYGTHRFTSTASDWEEKLIIPCKSYTMARKMELYVKKMKIRKFIEKIISSAEVQNFLIKKITSI